MKENDIKVYVWRKGGEVEHSYIFQVTALAQKITRAITEIGGRSIGEGYNPSTKQKIMLLEKCFTTKGEWLDFTKSLPFEVVELLERTGKERIINEGRK